MRAVLHRGISNKTFQNVLLGLAAVFVVGLLVFLLLPLGRSLLNAMIRQPMRLQDFLWGGAFAAAAAGGWALWNSMNRESR